MKKILLVFTSTLGLQEGLPIYAEPELFGIINVQKYKRTILDPKIVHEVSSGLTRDEVRKLHYRYRKTLANINKYPKEMNFYREHMLNIVK